MRWTLNARKTKAHDAYGEVGPDAAVLASSCVVAHRIERDIHAVTVAIKPFTGESTK